MRLTRAKLVSILPALFCTVLSSTNVPSVSADTTSDSHEAQSMPGAAAPAGTERTSIQAPSTGAASSEIPTPASGTDVNSTGAMDSSSSSDTTSTSTDTNPGSGSGSTSNHSPSVSNTTSTSIKTSASETAPGPLLEKRKLVLARIMAAKKQGTGISGYLAEYGRIEDMVKAGQPTTAYQGRLDSLLSGIDEQLKRSQILKTQHPTGSFSPTSASSQGSAGGSGSSGSHTGGGGGSGGISSDTINQLKAKYGDKIPAGLGDKIGDMSPEQREKLLQSDLLKKFLSK